MSFSTHHDISIDTARWVGDALIPDLPAELRVVPGFRLKSGYTEIPDGWRPTPGEPNPYEDETWRTDYFDWRARLIAYREYRRARAEASALTAEEEKVRCFGDGGERKGCPKYFGAVYGMIQEPRIAGQRGGTWTEFIPYHYQLHQTDRFVYVITRPFDEEIESWEPKSRGLGVSWNRSKDDYWAWRTFPEARIFLTSRNQSFVDSQDNIDALIPKILMMHSRLPDYLAIPGWSETDRHCRVTNRVTNTENGAEIIGSPNTPDAARAGRYLYGFIDEAAKMRNLSAMLGSVRGSMKKLFLTSTEDREVTSGQEWLEEWQATKRVFPVQVMEWNWHQNPTMDTTWEKTVLMRATSQDQRNKVLLEYFRDVFAGSGQYIYPEASKLPNKDWSYDPHKPLIVTTDPGKEDDVAFIVGQTTVAADGQQGFHFLFSYQRKLNDVEWMAHLRTGIWPEVGDVCYGHEPTPEERVIGAFFYQRWINGDIVLDFMDPYGDAAQSGYSYKNMLMDRSFALRAREAKRLTMQKMVEQEMTRTFSGDWRPPVPIEINPKTGLLKKLKTHENRRLATRVYLPYFTFQEGVPDAAWVRICLSNYRFDELGPDSVTEPKPVHDVFSHIVSCVEFTMVYYFNGWADPEPVGPKIPKHLKAKQARTAGGRQNSRWRQQTRQQERPLVESIGNVRPAYEGEIVW